MKQFYVLVWVFFLVFVLGFFSCEKNEEFISTETAVVNDISESGLKVPDLQDVKINFKSKTSINKLFQSSNSSKSSTGSDLNFSIDWESSFPTEFNPEMNLDVLYTPVHFNSTKRIKSFIASATINDTLVSQIVTLAYVGKPSLEYFNGYIFFHDLTGAFKSSSYYEFGEKIKTSYALNTKRNSTNKGSCAAAQFEYILEYGLDGYEDFFGPGLCTEVTVVAEISSSDGGGGGGSNSDFPSSGGMYIPTYSGGGGGGGSGGGTSTPSPTSTPSVDDGSNEPVSTLEPDPYWQEIIAPNESMIATLATELNLNSTQAEWLQNTQNNVNLRLLPFQIINFLDQNLWGIEAKNFAQEAIGVLMDDGKVFWEEGIIITKDVEKCAPGIISKLIIDKTYLDLGDMDQSVVEQLNLAGHILDIFNSSNKYNLIFDAAYLPLNSAGQKRNAMTTPERDPNNPYIINFRITLDKGLINNATDLAIARTIIHESLHAYLSYKYQDQPFSDLSSSLRKLLEASGFSSDKAQHNLMSQEFVNAISNSLANWDNNQINPNYYDYLSWSGAMLASPAYQSLSTDFQKNVFDANVAEGDAQNSFTSKAKGSVCQ
ncbi:hypothetical protein [Leeuwenhoekiella nanhaiensis]|uniref:Uncharacterized protein n=1 Tax=Leeuwenhoekiella nanhaiensis TaxID=1655491 RepID=A0A2G1VTD9_9FLAO|nr:hypothetical protein [Leeuwenhoekiella nanhaiensis]PHQ29699.1 hypothetical protein CJ305_06905 [Leeuwenhoekiella nanhaiensis]